MSRWDERCCWYCKYQRGHHNVACIYGESRWNQPRARAMREAAGDSLVEPHKVWTTRQDAERATQRFEEAR
jgi:DNA-binding LacI/PurR family transcriptional regulator